LPLTLFSDPAGSPHFGGLATVPFLATAHSSDDVSVFDNDAAQPPDTGDDGLTGALGDTLRCMSALYTILVGTVREHAGKLHATGAAYQATEESTHDLYDQLQQAFGSG
jgi:hypothetical protein